MVSPNMDYMEDVKNRDFSPGAKLRWGKNDFRKIIFNIILFLHRDWKVY